MAVIKGFFLYPDLPKAAVGHIAFRHDVMSAGGYVMLTNVKVDIQIYIDIYICVSLGGHTLGTCHAIKLKFGMLLTQT